MSEIKRVLVKLNPYEIKCPHCNTIFIKYNSLCKKNKCGYCNGQLFWWFGTDKDIYVDGFQF